MSSGRRFNSAINRKKRFSKELPFNERRFNTNPKKEEINSLLEKMRQNYSGENFLGRGKNNLKKSVDRSKRWHERNHHY